MTEPLDELSFLRRELHQTKDRLHAVLESALDCIITMDAKGRIVDFNPAAERTFGYSKEQAAGRTVEELLVPPRMRTAHRRGLESYHRTGTGPVLGRRIEIEALRADGTEIPVELAIVPSLVEGQAFFTAYLRDLTERRTIEAERERLLVDLQEKIADLERFHDVTVGRELKMIELEREVAELREARNRTHQAQ
jgi:PAS domain S-box-containing protein